MTLGDLVRPGMRVLLGDGLGTPRSVLAELPDDVRLVLGWVPAPLDHDLGRFTDVRTLMSGWGLRRPVDAGTVHAVTVRLGATPALLRGPLRPDLLVLQALPVDGGFALSTEVTWVRTVLDAGVAVAVVVRRGPRAEDAPPIPADRVTVVGETDDVATTAFSTPGDDHRALARQVVRWIPEGARLHVGPGAFGAAVQEAITVPVRLDTGLLGDGALSLRDRGLLVGTPVCTYLAGGEELFAYADGRGVLQRLEVTHSSTRLATGDPFVAVNTALELDGAGQVNVEGTATSAVGGIGGHPDYAAGATLSADGLSIVAVTTRHGGASTLVESLARPVTTPSHDVDVVVTETGSADLRGLDRRERAVALARLWEG